MCINLKHIIVIIVIIKYSDCADPMIEDRTATAYPCNEHKLFVISIELSEKPEQQNYEYYLYIHYNKLSSRSRIVITFTNPVNVTLPSNDYANLNYNNDKTEGTISFYREKIGGSRMYVTSTNNQLKVPKLSYITSVKINGEEKCLEPNTGVFDILLKGPQELASSLNQRAGPSCGRRQLVHTELITNSVQSKPGDWPWHAAIYRMERVGYDYKCGGTLLSDKVVLTAAHCLVRKGINKGFPPSKFKVYLGKYHLYDKDTNSVERQVSKIKFHKHYDITTVNNDIGLVLLKSEVQFNKYIQPVCLWNPEVFNKKDNPDYPYGTIVGWGFDTNDHLTSQLRQSTMPIIDGYTCVLSNHIFFGQYLNKFKFCAGYRNGTSACNGDSGGGFVVFAPDKPNTDKLEGSWYIKGIVSVGVSRRDISICQPNQYVLFTDVSMYKDWILDHMSFNDTEDGSQEVEEATADVQQSNGTSNESASCGKKKILHTELLTNAELTKPGDWPWHAAIYRKTKESLRYNCGGTLISKNFVLTRPPCLYGSRNNENITADQIVVRLGVHNIAEWDQVAQNIEVSEIIAHELFDYNNLQNDIALVRLETEAVYNSYVQPICLWKKELNDRLSRFGSLLGVVPGWGFDENGKITNTLRQASMPIVSDIVCAKNNDLFVEFSYNKFCAGYINGTSPCNGDSGGAMAVFVPDEFDPNNKDSYLSGSWYARGIVSLAATLKGQYTCDPHQYVFMTDLEKYDKWIEGHVGNLY